MSEKFCDILIVGCELPGLIAGAFLAKRGLSVIVLNTDHDVATKKKNIQPNLISHLDSRLFKTILGRLSIVDAELGIVNRYDTPYQVVLPKHRIDVTVSRERFHRELKREFPDQADSIRSFYLSLDELDRNLDNDKFQDLMLPRGLLQRFHFSKFIKENHLDLTISDWMETLNLNGEIGSFIEAQIKFLSALHSDKPFSYPLAKLLGNQNSVLFDVKGGIGQLKKVFLNKIESYSGKVKNEVKIESIVIEKRKAKGAKLGGFEGMIATRYLLWNQPSAQIEPWLPQNFISRWLLRKIRKVKPKFSRFSIQYEVDPEIIPVGMKGNLLYVIDPAQPLIGPNFLHLHFYYPTEPDQHPGAKRNLIVTYLLETEALDKPESFFEVIHEKITAQLHQLMPFSEGKVELTFPKAGQIHSGELLFPLEESDFEVFKMNASQNPIYEAHPKAFQDLFPFSNRTFYKNLLLTGPEILASLGFEGSFLLGLKTTDLVWKDFEGGKKKAIRQRKIA
ncbi:MAG: hypothetical protein U1F57_02115 [bacterium]